MKKILLIAFAMSVAFLSCKKDSPSKEEITDPFQLPYSNLPVEEQKKELENAGIEFVQKMNSLPDEKFIDVLDHLLSLEPQLESSSVSSVLSISSAAKKKDIKGIFRATTSATDERLKLSDLYKIYTWNASTHEWVKSTSTDKLEIRFPSAPGQASNDATLTVTYVASNVTASNGDGESVELPSSVTAVLKVGAKEELKLTSSYEYKSDGTPTKTEINLVFGGFGLKSKVSNDGTNSTTEFAFLKGTEALLSLNASANGNMTVDNANDNEDFDAIVKNANVTFEIMNIKLMGQADIKAIADANDAADNLSDSLRNIKEAEAFNKYSKFVAINKKDNSIFAKTEFVAGGESYCYQYYDGYQMQNYCYNDFYIEPRLVLKDGSKVSFEDYFENGFSQIIADLENFEDKF